MSEVDSTSDERTVNNSKNDVRHSYRVLSEEEKQIMKDIKDKGLDFMNYLDEKCGSSREVSIAKTNIEQAVMWAVKYVTM